MVPTSKDGFKLILERQQQSGLNIRDFCMNEGYTVSSFHYWKSKFGFSRPYRWHGRDDLSSPVIAPVSLKTSALGCMQSSQIQDVNSGEISIRFPSGVEVSFTGQDTVLLYVPLLNVQKVGWASGGISESHLHLL